MVLIFPAKGNTLNRLLNGLEPPYLYTSISTLSAIFVFLLSLYPHSQELQTDTASSFYHRHVVDPGLQGTLKHWNSRRIIMLDHVYETSGSKAAVFTYVNS